MNRREFLESVALAAAAPTFALQSAANEWGSPVFDLHFHLRPQPASNLAHLDGAGVTKANLLTRGGAFEQVKAVQAAAPGRRRAPEVPERQRRPQQSREILGGSSHSSAC